MTRIGRIAKLMAASAVIFAIVLQAQDVTYYAKPDVILRPSSAETVAAGSGHKSYRTEILPMQTKDRWIRAVQFQPGDPRVVRSAFFYVEKTGQWLGGWAPNGQWSPLPESVAAFLPVDSRIIVEIHYQSITQDVEDQSTLGLFFSDRKPLRPLTGMGFETRVQVPPGSNPFRLRREFTVISDSYAFAMRPEMAAAGRSMEISAMNPSGTSQVLLALRDFRHDLQSPYFFEQPVFLPKGTRIVATASYENSNVRAADDLFKLTMSMYPSEAYSELDARSRVRRPVAKRAVPKKTAPAKKPAAKPRAR